MYEFWYDYVKPKYGEKAKVTKKCVLERKFKFENHKNCLEQVNLRIK